MNQSSYTIQGLLSDDVLTSHYDSLGYDDSYFPQYIRIYRERYKRAVDKEVPNASDFALYCANNFMPWYDFYLRLGHSQLWADAAGKFAADALQPLKVTYENDPEILRKTFQKCYRVAKDAAIPELEMHCAKIAQGWGKGYPYGKRYAEMLISGADCRKAAKESDRYNRFCKRAHNANMSESTMWYFADLVCVSAVNPDHAWKLAQIREELLNQGYDGEDLDLRMEDFRKEVTKGRRKKKQQAQVAYPQEQQYPYDQEYQQYPQQEGPYGQEEMYPYDGQQQDLQQPEYGPQYENEENSPTVEAQPDNIW